MINNEKGWILLSRKLLNWQWWDDSHMLKFWIFLLLTANIEDKKWKGILVKRGQIITSLNKLSEKTKLSKQQIRTALSRLQDGGEITQETTHKFTIITICNFESYQDFNFKEQHSEQHTNNTVATQTSTQYRHTNNTVATQTNNCIIESCNGEDFRPNTEEEEKQHSEQQQLNNNNIIYDIDNNILGESFSTFPNTQKEKNLFSDLEENPDSVTTEPEEEKRKIPPKEKRKIFTPPTVDEVAAYIQEKNYHINAEMFFSWNDSKGWYIGKNKMKDWKAAVRTWEMRWKEQQKQNYYGNYQNRPENGTTRRASYEPRADIDPDEF